MPRGYFPACWTEVPIESPVPTWKRYRYALEVAACRALAWFIPKLSRPACVKLARALGTLAFHVDQEGRGVALQNLRCAFGERFSEAERYVIARASYQNFARTMLDLFWGQRLTRENFREHVEIVGFEPIAERVVREKRGAIIMCIHQGNWEWSNLVGPFVDWHLASPAEEFKNPQLAKIFRHLREHTGATIIAQENSLIRMLKSVKRGGITGMLIDLNLRPTQAATVVEAFGTGGSGLLMCVPLLHAVLAQRGKALLLPVITRPLDDGRLRITLLDPVEFPPGASLREITQRCWDVMEPAIHERPGEWLWPYKHFRYRPQQATREYPDYSNVSSQFEKLLKNVAAMEAEAVEPSTHEA